MIDILALLLLAFLCGYCLGKRLGREEGMEEGKATMSLLMRQQSYELGYCLLCHEAKETTDIERDHHVI